MKDVLLTSSETDEDVLSPEKFQARIDQEAQFAGEVRKQVENLGGQFNGIQTADVKIQDGFWMSPMSHRLTYILVDFS